MENMNLKKRFEDQCVWQIQPRKGINKYTEFRPLVEKILIGLNAFLLVHDYIFDDPTSLEYICKDFKVFCYILGVKVTDLATLIIRFLF